MTEARPQPRVVTPGSNRRRPALRLGRPVRRKSDLSNWQGRGGDAQWKVENGYMEVVRGTGDIQTRDQFGDIQLHLEFACPAEVKGDSQGRGNSGVFLNGRYEVQVLDGYDNPTYADGTTGAIYGQYPPLVNANRKPGEWQTYDIVFNGSALGRRAACPTCEHHRSVQRRSCAEPCRGARTDGTPQLSELQQPSPRRGSASAARPWRPCAVPQHLDTGAARIRRIKAAKAPSSTYGRRGRAPFVKFNQNRSTPAPSL